MTSFEDLGPNSGLVEEMYRRYLDDPQSVAEAWRDFFADYQPRWSAPNGNGGAAAAAAPAAPAAPPAPPAPAPHSVGIRTEPAAPDAPTTAPLLDGEQPLPLRGAAARIVENMEASLKVPTATSLRVVPAKLLEVNRQILNNHLRRSGGGGKVSFTHLIAYAVVQALTKVPNMNSGYGLVDGKPVVVRHEHVNLGLAVDVHRNDGSRSLLVPNIKSADGLDFSGFFGAYEELIRKVRTGKLDPGDFAGTTASITNPGTIGTVSSVPRLMPGQGFIVGVGSIGFPAEYEGTDPDTLARIAVGRVVTLTSTHELRVI